MYKLIILAVLVLLIIYLLTRIDTFYDFHLGYQYCPYPYPGFRYPYGKECPYKPLYNEKECSNRREICFDCKNINFENN